MRSWCFDSQESGGVYDREYGSAEIREVVGKLIGNGVYATPTTNMQVVADTGMTISVQPGNCWVKGAYGCIDTAEDLTIDTSSSGRVDLIVARFDLSLSYRSIRIMIIKGTDGSTTPPSLAQSDSVHDIQLAKINVRASATSILQSDITDTRHDSSVCGIVTGADEQIDATNLFAQFTTAFNMWFDEMKGQLSTDAAGNLQAQITGATNNLTAETDIADADYLPFYDTSAATHRKTLWSNIKAKLSEIYYSASYKPYQLLSKTTSSIALGSYWSDSISIPFTPTCIIASVECSLLQGGYYFAEVIKNGVFTGVTGSTKVFYSIESDAKAIACSGELNSSNVFLFTVTTDGVSASNITVNVIAFR